MSHERGHLDEDWGYGNPMDDTGIVNAESEEQQSNLSELVRDPASMHTLCLAVFRKYSDSSDSISTMESLGDSLNHIMLKLDADPFERSDILDLWSGSMNFAEFFLLVRELLVSMHRVMTVEVDIEDVIVNEMNQVKM